MVKTAQPGCYQARVVFFAGAGKNRLKRPKEQKGRRAPVQSADLPQQGQAAGEAIYLSFIAAQGKARWCSALPGVPAMRRMYWS